MTMNAQELIETYVTDVAVLLPRRQRNDVAFELRALLGKCSRGPRPPGARPTRRWPWRCCSHSADRRTWLRATGHADHHRSGGRAGVPARDHRVGRDLERRPAGVPGGRSPRAATSSGRSASGGAGRWSRHCGGRACWWRLRPGRLGAPPHGRGRALDAARRPIGSAADAPGWRWGSSASSSAAACSSIRVGSSMSSAAARLRQRHIGRSPTPTVPAAPGAVVVGAHRAQHPVEPCRGHERPPLGHRATH